MKPLRAIFIAASLWVAWFTREPHYLQLLEESLDATFGKHFRHGVVDASRSVLFGRLQAKQHVSQARTQNLGGVMKCDRRWWNDGRLESEIREARERRERREARLAKRFSLRLRALWDSWRKGDPCPCGCEGKTND